MAKRMLAIILCVCLLLPTMGLELGTFAAGANTTAYKKLADLPLTIGGYNKVDATRGELVSVHASVAPAVNLANFGYPTAGDLAAGKLGLQLDVSVYGDNALVDALVAGECLGHIELTSGGACDKEEINIFAGPNLHFVKNVWSRTVIDLADFVPFTSGGAFDPTGLDFMRIYLNAFSDPASVIGQGCVVKIVNVQIVDLTQPLSAAETPALGDGTSPSDTSGGLVLQDRTFEKIVDFDLKVRGQYTVGPSDNGQLFAASTFLNDPIDLTAHGFPTSGPINKGTLGLQFDLYLSGENKELIDVMSNARADGQIEFTSSGTWDKEEISTSATRLSFKDEEWVRCVIDLAAFTTSQSFNPAALNFMRIYYNGLTDFVGEQVQVKVLNVQLVDLKKPVAEADAPLVGDGSFLAEAPVWTHYPEKDGYLSEEVLVAGYNLKEYVAAHPELGEITDYAPIIQSLADGLSRVGGGTLYIPAGIYPCYSNIMLPRGVTLQGDWKNPDEDPKIDGTVLAVYAGRKEENGAPFITAGYNSLIQNMAFWYPEQDVNEIVAYPLTIETDTAVTVRNITFVNAYKGYGYGNGESSFIGCPEAKNIYGTPLYYGADIDMVADSFGWENIHFAPDYWINSGLPGAPVSADDQDTLREFLYYNAYGIILRRMDWSWIAYCSVKGYSIGLAFDLQWQEKWYTNGQCYELYFEDCATALDVEGVAAAGEMVTNMTVKNCEVGVWVSDRTDNTSGVLKLINADIDATDTAVWCSETTNVSLMDSIVRAGTVGADDGYFGAYNTTFLNEGPQVWLDSGTLLATIVDCVDGDGNPIEVDNTAACDLNNDTAPITMEKVPDIAAEDALGQIHKPTTKDGKEHVTIATLDNTGATDVSDALQALLTAQAATGGTVYLPAGSYRLNKAITIPTGVELKGSLDIGRAEMYYGIGTMLLIYHGRGTETGATVMLQENSGIRGVLFEYPEQYYVGEEFVPYPYTMQGQGKDVYIIDVTIRNGWRGIDLMTNRCDNHYVEDFRGACMDNFVSVGGGSKNGTLRNCHVQYSCMIIGANSLYGGWPSYTGFESQEEFRNIVYTYVANNCSIYTVGHVENELLWGLMNYAGYSGMTFIREADGGAADAIVYGLCTDYNTVAVDIQDADDVDFINFQGTSFNRVGDNMTKEMTLFRLGPDFDGDVNIWGSTMYENPDQTIKVENGTLRIYSGSLGNTTTMINVSKTGCVHLYDTSFRESVGGFHNAQAREWLVLAENNRQNVFVNGGVQTKPFKDTDGFGQLDNLHVQILRWDAPPDLQMPEEADIFFTEGFTDYEDLGESQQTFEFFTDGSAVVATSGDMLHIQLPGDTYTVGAVSSALELTGGKANALYRLETRLNIRSMRNTEYSAFTLMAADSDDNMTALLMFRPNGTAVVTDADGNETVIGNYAMGEWYRVGFEIDLRDKKNKTYRVYLMDDEYSILAMSDAVRFSDNMQGTDASINQLQLVADTDIGEDETVTMVSVDYLIAARSTASTFGMKGDVDGDNRVSSTDARLTLQYYVGKIAANVINKGLADVDGDGKVSSTDARLILQYYVGKIEQWPA